MLVGLFYFLSIQASKRDLYFSPYLEGLPHGLRISLEKNGRYLKDNLVFGRPIMKLGTLLFCLRYARENDREIPGVWKDVCEVFSAPEIAGLYHDLEKVNTFRNTRVAHVETRLSEADEAWEAMRIWLRTLNKMVEITDQS